MLTLPIAGNDGRRHVYAERAFLLVCPLSATSRISPIARWGGRVWGDGAVMDVLCRPWTRRGGGPLRRETHHAGSYRLGTGRRTVREEAAPAPPRRVRSSDAWSGAAPQRPRGAANPQGQVAPTGQGRRPVIATRAIAPPAAHPRLIAATNGLLPAQPGLGTIRPRPWETASPISGLPFWATPMRPWTGAPWNNRPGCTVHPARPGAGRLPPARPSRPCRATTPIASPPGWLRPGRHRR